MHYRGPISVVGDFKFSDNLNGTDVPASNARAYEREVLSILHSMATNPCGAILLNSIVRFGGSHHVDIVAYNSSPSGPYPNAASVPIDARGTVPRKREVRNTFGYGVPDPALSDPVTEQGPRLLGTGTGSNIMLLFTPSHFSVCRHLAALRPDEVLFHELVHAYRQIRGRCSCMGMGMKAHHQYPNREELLATVLQNTFVSAKNSGASLRDDYCFPDLNSNHQIVKTRNWNTPDSGRKQQGGALRDGHTYSETVMLENLGAITQLFEEERPLLTAIGRVGCTFNPFRDYKIKYGGSKPVYDTKWH